MKIGLGHVGMSPKDFWGLSLVEWTYLLDGYVEKNGGDPNEQPVSRSELQELMEKYPDGDRNIT